MFKYLALAVLIAAPQVAGAADLARPYRHHGYNHHRWATGHRPRRLYANDHVITCTTSNWLLFSTASCGGSAFDPLGVSGY